MYSGRLRALAEPRPGKLLRLRLEADAPLVPPCDGGDAEATCAEARNGETAARSDLLLGRPRQQALSRRAAICFRGEPANKR